MNAAPETEAELEAFRQKWREEVSARARQPPAGSSVPAGPVNGNKQKSAEAGPSTAPVEQASALQNERFHEEIAPRAYHDLPDKDEALKLGVDGQELDRNVIPEPTSALEHYERAVEKETQGHLSESMRHYRKAFKLDDGVHEAYKRKHFPPSSFQKPKPTNTNPSNASSTVPRTDHHSLHGSAGEALPPTLKQLVDEFSALRIEPPEPLSSLSPPERCSIAELPEELLTHILTDLAVDDVASFARLAQVCKRLAYLVLTEDSIWKQVAMHSPYGFPSMHYDFAVDVDGSPLDPNDQVARYLPDNSDEGEEENIVLPPTPEERALAYSALTDRLLTSHYSSSWRQMFRSRPRIRFNGCYISTVNYTRAGATSTNTLTWGAPIHVVTYFRYLRFHRDGSCISLLTTSEPADVVHHLTRANVHNHHGNIQYVPSAVMKDALRGRWRLSGPASSSSSAEDEDAMEGDVLIETEGVVPKYTYKMYLGLAHAGKGARNNKLAWKGFWSWNKLTDDWGKFELRNDKAFYWSRVRSYGDGGE
ncbi:Putative F-box only protein FBXO9/FBXO48 [Septoria linicola]|uniref:F-box only protein FBXO9/FBXO48 n=1 Tax=Septoria linicola TaxID=215465 RepID=A0A9Q9B557_9PEZI|nr:Putative F-box only protein FBXO9/FBXO48 [Septoria linicola]